MDWLVYILFRAVSGALSCFSLPAAIRIGRGFGWAAYWLAWPYRQIASRNLTIAYGHEKNRAEIAAMVRRHFILLGGNFFAGLRMSTMPIDEIFRTVTFENEEWFKTLSAKGRGVILLISHMGNWELIAQVAPLLFPGKGGTIYQRLSNRYIDAAIRSARARQGLTLFERSEGFSKVIALLRSGGGVGVLIDQHAGDKGVWSPLFDRLASTTPLAATLAMRTGAVLLPAALYTEGVGRWRFSVSEPLEPASHTSQEITAAMNQSLEALIREVPEDWFWVHNRWKTPRPNFLLAGYKRGAVFPEGYDPGRLKPFRVVVRSSNWLGDAVMTLPAVQAIKRGRPDLHLAVLVRSKLADFWRQVPEVDEVLTIDAGESPWSVARKLRAGRFEAAVILPNSVRTALEVWLAGIPVRVGYPAKWRRWLLDVEIRPPKGLRRRPAAHQVHHYLEIARRIGAAVEVPRTAGPEVFFNPAPLRREQPVKSEGLVLGLCPGAEYGAAKRWMPERFAETAGRIAREMPCEWLLFGVGGDAPVGAAIEAAFEGGAGSRMTNLIGKTTLAELMERLAGCDLLLTNDTGTMHLAAALGVPTVAIFGSTEPRLTAPLGPRHTVLRHQVECSPCFLRECPIDFRCMEAVTVDEAVAAIRRSLA
ncbi:MAG TPA: lipopolysaccharide heptosyltransferase II [Chthoniobacteraceae bacterium]|nr:lipopolysaccharide heptosyltransferase II [Chthoniobacteraceae bacterium]